MVRKLSKAEILNIIPHRFENELIDTMELFQENEMRRGNGTVRIAPGDTDGRDIFLPNNGLF